MSKLQVVFTSQFKKDYKQAMKRTFKIALLDEIIRTLSGEKRSRLRIGTMH